MDKTPLLLLPGLLCDARLWQPQVDALADLADCTVADLTGADTMAGLARAALGRMRAERFALAGLSMGGYLALELVRQAPERVAGLALLDTSARPDTPEATANRHRLLALAARDFPAVNRTLLPKLLHPAHLSHEKITGVVTAMADAVGPAAFARQQAAIIGRIDSRPHLAAIDCPALVLCGRDDQLTPPELHEEMAAAIPGASRAVVEQCGHLSTLEQPRLVADALRTWLLRVQRHAG